MKDRAFTLVELVVIVSLITIILSIATLNGETLKSLYSRQNLKAQSQEVLQALIEGRALSIMDGKIRKVYIFKDKIYIQEVDGKNAAEKISLESNIKITANTFSSFALEFKPIGTVNKGGHFTFENSQGDKMTIVIQIGSGVIYLKGGPA